MPISSRRDVPSDQVDDFCRFARDTSGATTVVQELQSDGKWTVSVENPKTGVVGMIVVSIHPRNRAAN